MVMGFFGSKSEERFNTRSLGEHKEFPTTETWNL